MLSDKNAVLQVIGSLMKKPSLLSEKDKYNLQPNDFESRFERYIFIAILNSYNNGAQTLSEIDIDNYLMEHKDQYLLFQQNNGISYLQDALDMSTPENFEYYYNRIKKFNCLKDLKKSGFDISEFYEENELNPKQFEINQRFETLKPKDIFDGLKRRIYKVEGEYVEGDASVTTDVSVGIDELLEKLKNSPDAGARFQGKYFNTVTRGARKGKYYLVSLGSGVGKALPNSSTIPTPNGWRTVKDIQVGDYLFDAMGKPTKVLGVYPQGEKEVWEVTFKDGRTVKCCGEHLWSYFTDNQSKNQIIKRNFKTSTTKELSSMTLQDNNGGYKIFVPMQKAVEYSEKKHFIPPYAFGLMLGDGSFRFQENQKAFSYSSENEILPNEIAILCGWNVKRNSDKNYNWTFSYKEKKNLRQKNVWVQDILIEHPELIGVKSEDKFIPRNYLEDSVKNRFALLNGLLDSDGSVDEKGRVSLFTISEQMKNDIVELARSLGFKTHVRIDSHKKTNICYDITITGTPEDKNKLFRLPRKREKMNNWFMKTNRKESNLGNPIVSIAKLKYSEEMTCFYVDNEEHLFLAEDFCVTHNTRFLVGEACYLAFPMRYSWETMEWKITGNAEKTLFIATEQTKEEIQTMIVAYLTGINEDVILYGHFTKEQQTVIEEAKEVIKKYKDNLMIVQIPMPSVEVVKSVVRQNCIVNDIKNVIFDYIFSNPALLNEFRDLKIREDVALLMLSTALKDLAVEQDIFMMSATQLNSNQDTNEKGIKNQNSIRGSRAIVDKADIAMIGTLVPDDQRDQIAPYVAKYGMPTQVFDVYKVRRGKWTNLKIWSNVDLGTCRRSDVFVTDSNIKEIEVPVMEVNFDDNYGQYDDFVRHLNSSHSLPPRAEQTFSIQQDNDLDSARSESTETEEDEEEMDKQSPYYWEKVVEENNKNGELFGGLL